MDGLIDSDENVASSEKPYPIYDQNDPNRYPIYSSLRVAVPVAQ